MATHSSILAWRIPWRATVHRFAKSWIRLKQLSINTGILSLTWFYSRVWLSPWGRKESDTTEQQFMHEVCYLDKLISLFSVPSIANGDQTNTRPRVAVRMCFAVLSCVPMDCVTPWTVVCQAPLSMGFFQAVRIEWANSSWEFGTVDGT